MKKVLLMTAMSLMMCMGVFAQNYLNPPKANERVLGNVSIRYLPDMRPEYADFGNKDDWHNALLQKAKKEHSGRIIYIREMQVGSLIHTAMKGGPYYHGPACGKVVCTMNPEEESQEKLIPAISKALLNVPKGSRMAVDKITVPSEMDREKLKDQLIDVLLDSEYRIVAREYLEKLYKEQQDQQSGIYNERTTVQENNFSAVGYFVNVKVTETSIRVQVVNVSTGEYEGNATVNF